MAPSQIAASARPYLISRGSDLPFILILFGVVGVALGLFLSPTLLAVGYEFIRAWNAVEPYDHGS
jgi:predicted PurR-regulated permease PerM